MKKFDKALIVSEKLLLLKMMLKQIIYMEMFLN